MPYLVAPIAFGDAYLYCNGILCYVIDDKLRILDIHKSGEWEFVISIPKLLVTALPGPIAAEETQLLLSYQRRRGNLPFKVLYSSHTIVTCLFTPSLESMTLLRDFDADSPILRSRAWLIAFDVNSAQILVVKGLHSNDIRFVRHSSNFLYYGIQEVDGLKRWVVYGHEFGKSEWFDPFYLRGIFGSEIGSQVCFEIFEEHFYALSNETSYENEEIDWTSYYTCLRFPLGSPCNNLLQKTRAESMWRAQYGESCDDNRWTSLRLYVDETTGKIRIAESRRELHFKGGHQRTCYTSNITFPALSNAWKPLSAISITALPLSYTYDPLPLPDEPILHLLRPDDHPHYFPPLPRLPQDVHPDNDDLLPNISGVPVRYYSTSAMAFLDLFSSTTEDKQSLRLRVQSRQPRNPLVYPPTHQRAKLLCPLSFNLPTAIKEMYQERIEEWPPARDPRNPEDDSNAFFRLLNPPTHLGAVTGTADERSIVYATGSDENDTPQAIIFICFDPAIKLLTLKGWKGAHRKTSCGFDWITGAQGN